MTLKYPDKTMCINFNFTIKSNMMSKKEFLVSPLKETTNSVNKPVTISSTIDNPINSNPIIDNSVIDNSVIDNIPPVRVRGTFNLAIREIQSQIDSANTTRFGRPASFFIDNQDLVILRQISNEIYAAYLVDEIYAGNFAVVDATAEDFNLALSPLEKTGSIIKVGDDIAGIKMVYPDIKLPKGKIVESVDVFFIQTADPIKNFLLQLLNFSISHSYMFIIFILGSTLIIYDVFKAPLAVHNKTDLVVKDSFSIRLFKKIKHVIVKILKNCLIILFKKVKNRVKFIISIFKTLL